MSTVVVKCRRGDIPPEVVQLELASLATYLHQTAERTADPELREARYRAADAHALEIEQAFLLTQRKQ